MAKLKLVDQTAVCSGVCRYADLGVYTKTDFPYAMNNCFFDIDTIGFRCTAWKQILTIDAHLPPHLWRTTDSLTIPCPIPGWSFAFAEQFDENGIGHESSVYTVVCDLSQKSIQIIFGEPTQRYDVFVSPHRGFLIGADPERDMQLSTVLLLNVEGFPDISNSLAHPTRRP